MCQTGSMAETLEEVSGWGKMGTQAHLCDLRAMRCCTVLKIASTSPLHRSPTSFSRIHPPSLPPSASLPLSRLLHLSHSTALLVQYRFVFSSHVTLLADLKLPSFFLDRSVTGLPSIVQVLRGSYPLLDLK
jgi:hypothetical protein